MKNFLLPTLILISAVAFGQIPKTPYKKIGDKTVYIIESKKVFIVTSGFMIDGNAGKPGNWWALVPV